MILCNEIVNVFSVLPRPIQMEYKLINFGGTELPNCPKEVMYFYCTVTNITSLEHCPEVTHGDFMCHNNKISSLKGIGKDYCLEIHGKFDITFNPLTSNILGILKIKGLKKVLMNNKEVEEIMNKHLVDKDLVKCRHELIEAGFKEFAKL